MSQRSQRAARYLFGSPVHEAATLQSAGLLTTGDLFESYLGRRRGLHELSAPVVNRSQACLSAIESAGALGSDTT